MMNFSYNFITNGFNDGFAVNNAGLVIQNLCPTDSMASLELKD